MNLDELYQLVSKRQSRKRVGRGPGSGVGETAGRGDKGAKSRSGYKRQLFNEGGQMPLARRLPKRGFSNYAFKVRYEAVNLDVVAAHFGDGETVDPETLVKKGLVKADRPVKILARGELPHKLTVKVHRVSAKAKEAIEAKGGTIDLIPTRKDKWEAERIEKIKAKRAARAERAKARA